MNPKYEKFFETDMYIFYGQYAFEEDIKIEQKEEFEQILYNLKKVLNIDYEVDDDQNVFDYINKYESTIEEEDIQDFIVFVKVILEKIYFIINNLKSVKKESTKQTLKNMETNIKQVQREQLQREKDENKRKERAEREEQRRIEKETKEHQKRLLKEQLEIEKQNNKRIIRCDCGIEYAYYTRFNHLKSHDHILRLEGIRYFIKEHNLNFNI